MKTEINQNKKETINDLPQVIADLVKAQNNFDSAAYADCFSETAVVFDEGKTHTGKMEIKNWIAKANQDYQATMNPIEYAETTQILKAETSGNFPGSPIVLQYHLEINNGYIQSLKITG